MVNNLPTLTNDDSPERVPTSPNEDKGVETPETAVDTPEPAWLVIFHCLEDLTVTQTMSI